MKIWTCSDGHDPVSVFYGDKCSRCNAPFSRNHCPDHPGIGEIDGDCPVCAAPDHVGSEPATTMVDTEPIGSTRRLVLTAASEIEPVPVVWAWEDGGDGRIPSGSLSVAAGREGTGKSSFGIWLAAQITRGRLPGQLYGKPRAVIYAAVEDSWKYTLVPRLIAAGADRSMVYRCEVYQDDALDTTLSLPLDNVRLEVEIRRLSAALLVLDPLMSTIGAKIDTHRERDVRTALDPLARLADRARCVVLGIAHFNKGSGTDPSSLITGSGAFKNVPRSVFGFAVDREDGQRVMTQTKNSLGKLDLPSLQYAIEDTAVPTRDGPAHVGQFVWLGQSDRTVSDILSDSVNEDRDERQDCAAWLRSYLIDNGGEAVAVDVFKAGDKNGFSRDALKRAKRRAGVASRKESFDAGWMWVLNPQGSANSAKGADSVSPHPSHPSRSLGDGSEHE